MLNHVERGIVQLTEEGLIMRCLQCYTQDKNGYIVHKKGCSDWYYPNHTTRFTFDDMRTGRGIVTENLLDDFTYVQCGWENPGRPGNFCTLEEDHWNKPGEEFHRDGEDNEWRGRDLGADLLF